MKKDTAPISASDREWEVECDYNHITRAIEVLKDKKRMDDVRAYAASKLKLNKEITDMSDEYLSAVGFKKL